MNPDFHFVLAMDVIVCTTGVGNVLLTSVVYESNHFGGGSVMVWAWICHDGCTQLKIIQGTLNVVKCRRYSWSYCSALSATTKVWSRLSTWQYTMPRGSCLSRLFEPESHPCSSLAGIITGSVTNWTVMGWNRYTCSPRVKQHPTSLYAQIGYMHRRSCRCCKRWSRMLLKSANFHAARQFMSVHDMFW